MSASSYVCNGKECFIYACACFPGVPEPLGPSPGPSGTGVNFALYSEHASAVALEIYDDEDHSVREFNLDASKYKTGHVWHVLVEGLPLSGVLYAFKVQGDGGWETGGRSAVHLTVKLSI